MLFAKKNFYVFINNFLVLTFLIGLAPQYILGIGITIPFILGISGLIFAILGIKGPTRMILVVLNSFILVVFIGIYLMAFMDLINLKRSKVYL